jgi:CHAT domain-containing protein
VSDACTTALMIKFYEYLHRGDAEGGKVGECLAMAQRWLREAKMSEVMRLLPKSARDAWDKEKGKFVAQRKGRDARAPLPVQNVNVGSRRRERGATARRQRCAGGRVIATASHSAGGGTVTGTSKASAVRGEEHASVRGVDTSCDETRSGGDVPCEVEEPDVGRKAGTGTRRCRGAFSSPFYWSSFVVIGW